MRESDRRAARGLLAGLILLVGLVATGVATQRVLPNTAANATAAAVTRSVLVCPDARAARFLETELTVADTGPDPAGTTVAVAPLATAGSRLAPIPSHGTWFDAYRGSSGAFEVVATGPDAADVAAGQGTLVNHGRGRGLTGADCLPARPDWWFVGLDGRVGFEDTLLLSNPTDAVATARISVLNTNLHVQTAPSLQSVSVGPHSTTTLALARIAPDVPDVTAHVHVTQGQLVAAANDTRVSGTTPQGDDWLPASPGPSRSVTLSPLPSGSGLRQLLVTDTAGTAASVSLKIFGPSGEFAPNGKATLDVPAGTSAVVDLSAALQGQAGTIALTSDQPIVAGALAIATMRRELPDLTWSGAARPLTVGAAFPQDYRGSDRDNRLLVTATQGPAVLDLADTSGHTARVRVAASTTASVDVDALLDPKGRGPGVVRVAGIDGTGVYAVLSVSLDGAHGPLVTAFPPEFPRQPVRVPSLVIDPAGGVKS